MVHFVEDEDAVVIVLRSHRAANEVTEPKPLAALGAELWLKVPGNGSKLQVDLFPAESVSFPEEPDELGHVDGYLLPRRRRGRIRSWTNLLVHSIVVCLEVQVAELVRHEEVTVCVDEGAALVTF